MMTDLDVERRRKLEERASEVGYNLDYEPQELMKDIRILPDSYWHENRAKGWGGSDEGVLNDVSSFKHLVELVNDKLFDSVKNVLADKQFMFDFGHVMEPIMLKYYAAVKGYKFLTYRDYFVLVHTDGDVHAYDKRFELAQDGVYSFVTRDHDLAESLLSEIKKKYPRAEIVEQESNEPKDVRDITDEEHQLYDAQGIVCVDRRQYLNSNYLSKSGVPFMLGDMDGLAISPDGERIGLECKTYGRDAVGSFVSGVYGETGRLKSMSYYYQVVHYMATLNIDRFDVIATCGNDVKDFTITTVYRDIDEEKQLCDYAKYCWDTYIEDLEPVVVDEITERQHTSYVESITPEKVSETAIDIPSEFFKQIHKLEELQDSINETNAQLKRLQKEFDTEAIPVESVLASNSKGYAKATDDEDYLVTFKPSVVYSKPGFDDKKLQAEMPDVWELFKFKRPDAKRKIKVVRTPKRDS